MSKTSLIANKYNSTANEGGLKNDEGKQIPTEDYIKWYLDTHTKDFKDVSDIAPVDYEKGSLKRLSNISSLEYLIQFKATNESVVVFHLYDNNLRKTTNYAMVFCRNIKTIPPEELKEIAKDRIMGQIAMMYYSTSSSLISCDGEFRSKLCRFNSLLSTKLLFTDVWDEIEYYITIMQRKRDWYLSTSYFYDKNNKDDAYELEKTIKSNFIGINLLVLSWFNTIFNAMLGITETHMNEIFKEIFLQYVDDDISFIKELIKKYSSEKIENFRLVSGFFIHKTSYAVSNSTDHKHAYKYIPLGYKMMPLNVKEVEEYMQIRYKPWKEYIVASRCNDLVINQIAPGFPIILDWFLIKDSNKGLFDNTTQFERLRQGELAKDILHTLKDAQHSTYFATTDIAKKHKTDGSIKKWISSKFKTLNDKIQDPIDYTIKEIIMSNISLVTPVEFVGRTTVDTYTIIKTSKEYNENIGIPLTNYDYFAKYVFEICYNLLAINTRFGVIHGDFHLNNSTIGFLYKADSTQDKVVYALDEKTRFVFNNNGYFSCVIDFSRAIINPNTYNILTDHYPTNFSKVVKNFDKFEHEEINNLLNLYLTLYPAKSKQKAELLVLFKNQFDAVFKLLTCIDLFMYSIRLGILLNQPDQKVNKFCIELVEKISKLAELYISQEMNKLLEDEAYSVHILENEWPIATIIKKCFSNYLDGNAFKNIGVITDLYCLTNELKHSLNRHELFPESIKDTKYYDKSNKVVPINFIINKKRQNREEYEKQRNKDMNELIFLANKLKIEYE